MKLSQREKYIAMGSGAAVLLLILDQLVFSPYFDALSDISKQTDAAVDQQRTNTDLLDKQIKLKPVWTQITSNLLPDESAAQSQASRAALEWAVNAGVNITAVKPERTSMTKDFEVIGFHMSGTGTTPAVARLLQAIETADIPVHLDDLAITPVKEGTDNLKIELSLSTLCLKAPPDSTEKPNITASMKISEAQPWTE